jgi:hypothetical protein
MGAYVHSPLRGLIFGGVTHHMLAGADAGADATLILECQTCAIIAVIRSAEA